MVLFERVNVFFSFVYSFCRLLLELEISLSLKAISLCVQEIMAQFAIFIRIERPLSYSCRTVFILKCICRRIIAFIQQIFAHSKCLRVEFAFSKPKIFIDQISKRNIFEWICSANNKHANARSLSLSHRTKEPISLM